jgi:hypothetical protein
MSRLARARRRTRAFSLALGVTVAACGLDVVGTAGLPRPPTEEQPAESDAAAQERDAPAESDFGDAADAGHRCPARFAPESGACVDRARDHVTLAANPSGNWTWAYREADASAPIVSYPASGTYDVQGVFFAWTRTAGVPDPPSVYVNPSDAATHPYGTFTMAPFELAFHPGALGERSVVRWTAPEAGDFALVVTVHGLSGWNGAQQTTTGVTVRRGAVLLGSTQLGPSSEGPWSVTAPLGPWTQGEMLDVLVDYGANGDYGYDSTGIDVTMTAP